MCKEPENFPEEDVEKIESTVENWENGKLGNDERYVKRSDDIAVKLSQLMRDIDASDFLKRKVTEEQQQRFNDLILERAKHSDNIEIREGKKTLY
jgi:hypothetical protein